MRGGANRWRRRAECDTRHVADATNDATIRPGHCVLRKRPDEPHTTRASGFYARIFPLRECRGVLLAPSSGLPPRHFLLAPGPVSPAREPAAEAAARWATAGIRRTQAARTCNAAPRSSRSKAGLPPPGNWIPATGLRAGPIFRARPARHATGVNHAAAACTGRVAGVSPPWPGRHQRSPDGSRAWRITPPPAATCASAGVSAPRRRRTGGRVPGLYRRRVRPAQQPGSYALAGGRRGTARARPDLVPHGHPVTGRGRRSCRDTRSGRGGTDSLVRHESIEVLCSMIGRARAARGAAARRLGRAAEPRSLQAQDMAVTGAGPIQARHEQIESAVDSAVRHQPALRAQSEARLSGPESSVGASHDACRVRVVDGFRQPPCRLRIYHHG